MEKQRTIESYLGEVMTIPRKDILRVYIFSDDVYYSTRTPHTFAVSDDNQNETWYQTALESSTPVFLPVQAEEGSGYKLMVFSMVQRLRSLSDSNKILGVIRVDANYSGIQDVLDQVQMLRGGALYIVDSTSNVIYRRSELKVKTIEDVILSRVENKTSPQSYTIENEKYIVNTQTISGTDWIIVAVNMQSELLKNVETSRLFTLIMAFACACLGIVVSVLFTRSFVRPIHETVDVMHEAQNGRLDVRAKESGPQEIAYLNRSFNEVLARIGDMMEKNARLSKEMYEAKYLQKKAQYDALYNQIRPHFLFNTLSTLSLLVKEGRDSEAIRCIDELSVLLRGMVNTDREITLAQELKIVESYLFLQQHRHDAFRYQIEADQALLEYGIPAMTVQPIVENALIHGCEPKMGASMISVLVKQHTDEKIRICVADDGVGMDDAQLTALNEMLAGNLEPTQHNKPRSVGLTNVAKRLQLKYGKGCSIQISSQPEHGTRVEILLPYEAAQCKPEAESMI